MPGLGIFTSFCERASFDVNNGIFYPAKKRIIFSEKFKLGNEVLLTSIGRELKLDKKNALSILKNFVNKVKSGLDKNKYCKLEGMGYLIMKGEKIIFQDILWKNTKHEALYTP